MAYTTIDKPTDYFNTKLYTGNGSTQSITGVGFQPDWCLIKNRNQALNPVAIDSVRGLKYLYTNSTSAEGDYSSAFTSFDSDGFSVGATDNVNGNGNGIVAFNWLAGGSASSNSNGSITSSVSANTTAGFSIVKWTGNVTAGATVGHGLGSAPKVVITKRTDGGTNKWVVGHGAIGFTEVIYLNETDAKATDSGSWNNTAPSSTVFTVGNNNESNGNGYEFISYCFAEKKGYSKFGSYTGNGNADGTFVYTGFKPAWLLVKKSSASGSDWNLHNNKSPGFNVNDNYLAPNENAAEVTNNSYQIFDFTAQGFKCRGTGTGTNGSGATYIFMAFAESPFVTAGTKAAGTAR